MSTLTTAAVASLLTFLLSGCAAVVEGTSQQITINTNPSGAACDVTRQGERIGSLSATPGSVTVQKTKHDITVTCQKKGYETVTYINKSGANVAGTGASILLTGGIGWAIDSASGADNKYEPVLNLTLVKK